MTTFVEQPALVNIVVSYGSDLIIPIDFSISLSGYTLSSYVVKPDGTTIPFTISGVDLGLGQIALILTDSQITSLGTSLPSEYSWDFYWKVAGYDRKVLTGKFIIQDPES